VFSTLRCVTAVISYAGLVFVTMTCTNYLLVIRLSSVRLRREETFLSSSPCSPAQSDHVSRLSFLRLKYPSSYPDFKTVPFCSTTVTRPVNFNLPNKLSVAALSRSNSCTFRRNSAKEEGSELCCFESIPTSKSANDLYFEIESEAGMLRASTDLFLQVVMVSL